MTRISWLNAYVIRGRNLSVAVGFGQVHIDDLTEDGVKYNLKRLKALGLIQREGADNGGHWRTIDNGENELSDNDI